MPATNAPQHAARQYHTAATVRPTARPAVRPTPSVPVHAPLVAVRFDDTERAARAIRDVLLKPHPKARRGGGDPEMQRLAKRLQQDENEAHRTVARRLAHNGRWGELADVCEAQDAARATPVSLESAIAEEAAADCALRGLELRFFSGDHSTGTLAGLTTESRRLERAARAIRQLSAITLHGAARVPTHTASHSAARTV